MAQGGSTCGIARWDWNEGWDCMLDRREVTPASRTVRWLFIKLITRIKPVQLIRYQELPGLLGAPVQALSRDTLEM
ncbi:LSU ribosomal protein L15p (L27Ae), mitochondrial [Paraburkholderia dioscoreae]|uniref:LSU ribosomal protein L15p (L27Ae), mitochondrial n=1 Tax=Paraburkholderia dioscoreae TaxID=2604047 RepID=A0A5Q4ZV34_9BURK|nr:LSU ribosomal protein L15p (L27Ae), mitochondrial [Paraburkholderia dioscoreae]